MPRLPSRAEILRAPNLVLLSAICAALLLGPLLEKFEQGTVVRIATEILILFTAVRVAGYRNKNTLIIGYVIGFFWICMTAFDLFVFHKAPGVVADTLFMSFVSFVAIVMLGQVVTAKHVTADVLCATAAIYLLLAVSWGVLYFLIQKLLPGSFAEMGAVATLSFGDLVYFSLCTITTTGFGDISPLHPFARMAAALEGVIGTFYIAVLVARLVGLYSR